MNGNAKTNLLTGPLWRQILLFALPLAATGILQQLFNAADIAVVGRFVGDEAMAAVGSTTPLINLFVNIFIGISIGANVVISQYIGKKDPKKIHAAVHTALVISFASGVLVAVLGWTFVEPMLRFMDTPENVFPLSKTYLLWYFAGIPFMMLYDFESAIFRSIGDTRTPLLALVFGGALNVALNLFFVLVFGLGVAGVAASTLIAGVVCSAILFVKLRKSHLPIHLEYARLHIDWKIFAKICKIGIPAGIQSLVYSFSNVCMQGGINSLGSDAMAGSAAGFNVEIFEYFVINAFGQAAVTFIGQNYGAHNLKRCREIVAQCLLLDLFFCSAVGIPLALFGEKILCLFTKSDAVITYGFIRIGFVVAFEALNAMVEVFSGASRGYGNSFSPALFCVIGICGVRLLWLYTVFPHFSTFDSLMMVYPISWGVAAFFVILCYLRTRNRAFRLGKTTR